jgi:hypothetical protein
MTKKITKRKRNPGDREPIGIEEKNEFRADSFIEISLFGESGIKEGTETET